MKNITIFQKRKLPNSNSCFWFKGSFYNDDSNLIMTQDFEFPAKPNYFEYFILLHEFSHIATRIGFKPIEEMLNLYFLEFYLDDFAEIYRKANLVDTGLNGQNFHQDCEIGIIAMHTKFPDSFKFDIDFYTSKTILTTNILDSIIQKIKTKKEFLVWVKQFRQNYVASKSFFEKCFSGEYSELRMVFETLNPTIIEIIKKYEPRNLSKIQKIIYQLHPVK